MSPQYQSVGMAYDKRRHEMVLFAGTNYAWGLGISFPSQTWVYDGATWTQRFPAHSPQQESGFQMAYDERRGVVILITSVWLNRVSLIEHWEWDGTDWTNIPLDPAASPRFGGFAIAYDSRRDKLVLFGGELYNVTDFEWRSETWEYDSGSQHWTYITSLGPWPRAPGGMAYDAARGKTVLVAGEVFDRGINRYVQFDDTWVWDGLAWTPKAARLPAGPVQAVNLVYDEFSKLAWVFGAGNGNEFYVPITWAWDGDNFRCWRDPSTPIEGVCTNDSVGGGPSLLLYVPGEEDKQVLQTAPAGYDSDRLRVMALGRDSSWLLARGNRQPVNFVDWRNPTPPGDGTARNPFNTVQDAIPCVTDGSTLFIQSGIYQAGPITIRRRVDLIPLGGSATIR